MHGSGRGSRREAEKPLCLVTDKLGLRFKRRERVRASVSVCRFSFSLYRQRFRFFFFFLFRFCFSLFFSSLMPTRKTLFCFLRVLVTTQNLPDGTCWRKSKGCWCCWCCISFLPSAACLVSVLSPVWLGVAVGSGSTFKKTWQGKKKKGKEKQIRCGLPKQQQLFVLLQAPDRADQATSPSPLFVFAPFRFLSGYDSFFEGPTISLYTFCHSTVLHSTIVSLCTSCKLAHKQPGHFHQH